MGVFRRMWNKIPESYRGIVLFLLCLFGSNYLWEFTIEGDELSLDVVTFCGADISWMFTDIKMWFARVTHDGLAVFGVQSQLLMNVISFANGHSCKIIAGCSGVKQMIMMTVILLCARGRMVHKSWYCVVSIVVLVIYNVIRLIVLSYVVRDHQEWFEFMHVRVMKYIFYGLMFALWLVWDEWLRKRLQ